MTRLEARRILCLDPCDDRLSETADALGGAGFRVTRAADLEDAGTAAADETGAAGDTETGAGADETGAGADETGAAAGAETDVDADTAVIEAALADVDCVVTEHDPPGLDVTAVLRRVREVAPAMPVVVWTATDGDYLSVVAADDATSYVPRPSEVVETLLVSRVRGAIDEADGELAAPFEMVGEAAAVFDPGSRQLLAANDALLDRWGLSAATVRLDDLLVRARTDGGEPANLVADAAAGRDSSGEWHCEDAADTLFRATVRVRVDPVRDRGYLVADVPDPRDTDAFEGRGMLDALLEYVPLSIYFKDTESRHVAVSDEIPLLLDPPYIENEEGKRHYVAEDILGKSDFDLYPEHLAEGAVEDDEQIMETGVPIEDRVERPFGDPLDGTYVSTAKAPWYDADGQLQGIVGVTTDVSQQMRYEAQLERQNERLEEFADIVTHDLRNPLNVAQGRLELYRETGDPEDLATIREMHERMDSIIEDVLTFAREGDRVTDAEAVDAEALAAEAWDAVDTGEATLEQDWDHDVEADPDRLSRVFENLFRNAIEHADAEAIRVGTVEHSRGFYVEDDGPGIPEDEREEVFERGVTSAVGGTGFGLPIVREIAEAHGWEVRLTESAEGGARFEFVGATPVMSVHEGA